MNEDHKDQEETRSRSRRQQPKIGGISQYATIGGAKRTASDTRDVQTSGRSNVEDAERADDQDVEAEDTKRLDVQATNVPNVRDAERLGVEDATEVERPDVEAARVLKSETSSGLNVQNAKRSDVQTFNNLVVQKSKEKEERIRQTVYLELDLDEWVRDYANKERKHLKRRVEISEVVNNALRRMKNEIDD